MVDTRCSRPANEPIVPPSSVTSHDLASYSSLWGPEDYTSLSPLPPSPPLIGSHLFEDHPSRATSSPQGPRRGGGPVANAALDNSAPLFSQVQQPTPALDPTELSTKFVSPRDVFLTPSPTPYLELLPSQDLAPAPGQASGAFSSAASSGRLVSASAPTGTLTKDSDNGSSALFSEWFHTHFFGADIQVDSNLSDAPFDISPVAHPDCSQLLTSPTVVMNGTCSWSKLSSDPYRPLFDTAFAQQVYTHSAAFRPTSNEVQARAMRFDNSLDSPLFDESPQLVYPSDFDTSPAWPHRSLVATPDLDMDRMDLPTDSEPSSVATTPELVAEKPLPATIPASPISPFVKEEELDEIDDVGEDDEDEYKPVATGSRKRRATSANSAAAAAAAAAADSTSARPARVFNGTRKVQLTALDAPIQARNYKGDSKTARKNIPVNMAKTVKGKTEEEARSKIDEKRRQNTIAARETRQRKANHLARVESENEKLKSDNDELLAELDAYKKKYAALEAQLRGARGF